MANRDHTPTACPPTADSRHPARRLLWPARAMSAARRKARYGDGTLYQRGRVWWIKIYVDGRPHYESTGTEHVEDARRVLDTRRGERAKGEPIHARLDHVTYAEAAQALREHYRVTGARNLTEAEWRLAHLDAYLPGGGWRPSGDGCAAVRARAPAGRGGERDHQPRAGGARPDAAACLRARPARAHADAARS